MNTETSTNSPDIYSILSQTQRLRVSDGEIKPVLDGCSNTSVFQWARRVGAEVFGVAGEAKPFLFDCAGRKSVECFGVGNQGRIAKTMFEK